jgi:hypothetical protein
MTHDELLDQVQKMWDVDGVHELNKALRAVVELHKPSQGADDLPPCLQCGQMFHANYSSD